MPKKWTRLSRLQKKRQSAQNEVMKKTLWEFYETEIGWNAKHLKNPKKEEYVRTKRDGKTFWLEKSMSRDCPDYVSKNLIELNNSLGLTFYLDDVASRGSHEIEEKRK